MADNFQLWEEYEPKTFDDLLGQREAVAGIKRCLHYGYGGAMFFIGPAGVGKTSAAKIVARTMGIDPDPDASWDSGYVMAEGGATNIDALRNAFGLLQFHSKSGYRLLVVNQSDEMHAKDRTAFLGWLERIPSKAMVIFTSKTKTLSDGKKKGVDQLDSRGTVIEFEGRRSILLPYAQQLVQRVWFDKGGVGPVPTVEQLEGSQKDGQISFRKLLMQLRSRLPLPGEAVPFIQIEQESERKGPYKSERLAYIAREAVKKIHPVYTHKEAYDFIKNNTSVIQDMHLELIDYDVASQSPESWSKAVLKGAKAFESAPPFLS